MGQSTNSLTETLYMEGITHDMPLEKALSCVPIFLIVGAFSSIDETILFLFFSFLSRLEIFHFQNQNLQQVDDAVTKPTEQ